MPQSAPHHKFTSTLMKELDNITAPLCYIILLIILCSASNSSSSLMSSLSCNSYISNSIFSSNEMKDHLFNNFIHQNQTSHSYWALFDLCSISNPFPIDTIIYIYDLHSNLLQFNNNSDACQDLQSQIVCNPDNSQFIIGIGGSNSKSGICHLNITFNHNLLKEPQEFSKPLRT